jgi:hypothetical protein
MNSKHTPGPWQAYATNAGKHYVGTPHKGISHFVIADIMPHKMDKEANASAMSLTQQGASGGLESKVMFIRFVL